MSIEELFKAVVAALEANTKAVAALEASLAGRTPSKSAKPTKAEEAAAVKVDDPKPEVNKEPEAEQVIHQDENGDEVVDADIPASVLQYETVRNLVLKLAPTKREEIKALNTKHGIANLKVLLDKEDDFSTVNDQAKLGAVYADLQALEA